MFMAGDIRDVHIPIGRTAATQGLINATGVLGDLWAREFLQVIIHDGAQIITQKTKYVGKSIVGLDEVLHSYTYRGPSRVVTIHITDNEDLSIIGENGEILCYMHT